MFIENPALENIFMHKSTLISASELIYTYLVNQGFA